MKDPRDRDMLYENKLALSATAFNSDYERLYIHPTVEMCSELDLGWARIERTRDECTVTARCLYQYFHLATT